MSAPLVFTREARNRLFSSWGSDARRWYSVGRSQPELVEPILGVILGYPLTVWKKEHVLREHLALFTSSIQFPYTQDGPIRIEP